MYNSHYVPQFILKKYGGHFDTFNIDDQMFHHGLVPTQAFYVYGLYEDCIERLFRDNIEGAFDNSLQKLRLQGDAVPDCVVSFFREYLIISYLRTPFAAAKFDRTQWNEFLADLMTRGFKNAVSSESYGSASRILFSIADILSSCSIRLVTSEPASDPFLISDKGVTFLDADNAVYPVSAHEAIWASRNNGFPRLVLSEDQVISINCSILFDIYNTVGMLSLETVYRSIHHYKDIHPDDERFSELFARIDELDDLGHPEFN